MLILFADFRTLREIENSFYSVKDINERYCLLKKNEDGFFEVVKVFKNLRTLRLYFQIVIKQFDFDFSDIGSEPGIDLDENMIKILRTKWIK